MWIAQFIFETTKATQATVENINRAMTASHDSRTVGSGEPATRLIIIPLTASWEPHPAAAWWRYCRWTAAAVKWIRRLPTSAGWDRSATTSPTTLMTLLAGSGSDGEQQCAAPSTAYVLQRDQEV